MIRYLIAFVFLMHGLAHFAGVFAPWSKGRLGFSDRPWIFSKGIRLNGWVGRVFGLVWLAASILLASSAYGIFTSQIWWPSLAIAGSLASLLAILPWWKAVVSGAKAGAFFDLLIIVLLLSPLKEQLLSFLL